jgi:hypothetical protein
MHMRIAKSRQNKVAMGVNYACISSRILHHLFVLAYGDELPARDGYRFSPRLRVVDGVYLGVSKDQVGGSEVRLSMAEAEGHTQHGAKKK